MGRPLQELDVSYRPVELRSCIDEAYNRRQVVHLREVSWPAPGGAPRYFNVLLRLSMFAFGLKTVVLAAKLQRPLGCTQTPALALPQRNSF